MFRFSIRDMLNAGGAVAPIVWALTIIYCGTRHPGYSHYRQFMSELGERGSSTEIFMRYGAFVLPGLMVVGFGLLLLAECSRSKAAIVTALLFVLSGISRIGAGVFPCDPGGISVEPSFSQKMHMIFGMLTMFSMIAAGFIFSIAVWKLMRTPWFSWYSLISAVFGLFFLLMMRAAFPDGSVGLYQRLSVGIVNLWLLVLALMVWRSSTSNQAQPPTTLGTANAG